MKKCICLLMAIVFLLTGCGGNAPAEKEAPAAEPVVTTEPTTMPTEPKTFFEEQGFTFWEDFNVYDTQDGGIFAEANILDSAECKVTITSGGREETTYRLADTKVDLLMDEYTLVEFDEECKEKNWGAMNIKNASDSLYKAFKDEDSNLTKEAWLEQYKDYKIIHCQLSRTLRIANEVQNAKLSMSIGQTKYNWEWRALGETLCLLNCVDGNIYEAMSDDHPGIAEVFSIVTQSATSMMSAVAECGVEVINSGSAHDMIVFENYFVMIPMEIDNLAFVLPMVGHERTVVDFDVAAAKDDKVQDNAWEEKTFAEYTEGKDHLKYYFLSPYHH